MSPGRVGMGEGQRAPGAAGRGHWLRCYTNVFYNGDVFIFPVLQFPSIYCKYYWLFISGDDLKLPF